MALVAHSVIARMGTGVERFVYKNILGLIPDPATWPEPADAGTLPVPQGEDRSDNDGPAWILAPEFETVWPRRRTVFGARAYRFTETGDYDCGWRLVDCAARFVRLQRGRRGIDRVIVIPPPPIYTPTEPLAWSAERLARKLDAEFAPAALVPAGPIARHPDDLRKLPVIPAEFYAIAPEFEWRKKMILLCDWRWHRGQMMTIVSRRLARAGATVLRFAWLP